MVFSSLVQDQQDQLVLPVLPVQADPEGLPVQQDLEGRSVLLVPAGLPVQQDLPVLADQPDQMVRPAQ